jgi:hypothetical protein
MFIVCLDFRGIDGRTPTLDDATLPTRKPSKGWT